MCCKGKIILENLFKPSLVGCNLNLSVLITFRVISEFCQELVCHWQDIHHLHRLIFILERFPYFSRTPETT
jgi:hypothetical protein